LIGVLLWLIIEAPYIGIPAAIVVALVVYAGAKMRPSSSDAWESGSATEWTGTGWDETAGAQPGWGPPRPPDLSPLREFDPNFSQMVLEDFLYGLFVRAQELRGEGREGLNLLAPYLSQGVRGALLARGGRTVSDVTGVVIGAQHITHVAGLDAEVVQISVEFESNYTEVYPPGADGKAPASMGFYVHEVWGLSRKRSAQSRPPDKVYSLNCPKCGGPVEKTQDERCGYCGSVFGSGEFDWFVDSYKMIREETRGPLLTGFVQEEGTNLPTLVQPDINDRLTDLQEKDPEFQWEELQQRVSMIFEVMNDAWTGLQWDRVRPYVTDRFYLSQLFWINAYSAQGLRNILTGARITRMEMAKVSQDPFFDSVTVRLWATGMDYTQKVDTGEVVGGSNTAERFYSEYWTLIRSAATKGPARADKACPNCGGPLQINQAGHCDHCGSKVTGGAFDWALSRIQQDDSYAG
jgi:ribosomal protein L37AE/L43A